VRSPLAPWLVLAARGLEAAGWLAQQAGEREFNAEHTGRWCHRAVVWLGLGLQQLLPLCAPQQGQAQAAGAAEQQAALEQLLGQQAPLAADLLVALQQAKASDDSAPLLSPALAAQLQAFGAAVVAELPLPLCCNAPGCTSMQHASELLLASGKGCVCAGCGNEAARYCSRACQVRGREARACFCCCRVLRRRATPASPPRRSLPLACAGGALEAAQARVQAPGRGAHAGSGRRVARGCAAG